LRHPVAVTQENEKVDVSLKDVNRHDAGEECSIKAQMDECPFLPQLVDAAVEEALRIARMAYHHHIAHLHDQENDEFEEGDAGEGCKELWQKGAPKEVRCALECV
jgi:hypothetical protein